MKSSHSAMQVPVPEGKRAFRVVIAYNDLTSGRRAMDTCQLLVLQLGGDVTFCSAMWCFDLLQVPKLCRIATRDAIEADMIIVAANDSMDLPAEIKRWIECWSPQKRGQTAALVGMFDGIDGRPDDSLPIHSYLRQAAADARIDFLPHVLRAKNTPLVPYNMTDSPPLEGWGLND